MATTKSARYKFVVKEGPDFEKTLEPRDGVIEIIKTPVTFIMAEPCDRKPAAEYPLKNPDFLSLMPREGTSVEGAQQIAEFLNDHVEQVGITRFGDAEDATRYVRQSEREQKIHLERFEMVLEMLRGKLAAGDLAGAPEDLKAVESIVGDLINGWAKSVKMSREILDKFGQQNGDLDA